MKGILFFNGNMISMVTLSFHWRNDTLHLTFHLAVFIPKSVGVWACLSFSFFVRACSSYDIVCLLSQIIHSFPWLPWQMPHRRFQRFDWSPHCTMPTPNDPGKESFYKHCGKWEYVQTVVLYQKHLSQKINISPNRVRYFWYTTKLCTYSIYRSKADLLSLSFLTRTTHAFSSIRKWISCSNDIMNHVDMTFTRRKSIHILKYPWYIIFCSKSIRGI